MPQNLTNEKFTLAQGIGAVRQQAITWIDVDPELCCHMVSLGCNELSSPKEYM